MAMTLTRIQPIHPQFVPEPHWEMKGTTVHGRQLYYESVKMSRGVPLKDEKTGERIWSKNPLSGEPLIPKNKMEIFHRERLFYLMSQGNGQVEKYDYRPPTPEEIAKKLRDGKIAEMQSSLAAAFVDSDIPVSHLVNLLRQGDIGMTQEQLEASQAEEADEADPEDAEYPRKLEGRGKYLLSSGEVFTGSRAKAEDAQLAIYMEATADDGEL